MDIFDNLHSGVLSSALTEASNVATSGNFAFLPAVVAPNTLRLTIDPSGVRGFPPEIVVVTAHAANSTTVTIARAAETGFGGGPARLWPLDTVWRHSLTRASIVEMMEPAGTIKGYIGTVAPLGYLMLNGATVAGASSAYPSLWAVAPASWKAGVDLNLPNMASTFLAGAVAGAVGGAGGSNSHALTAAELPASTITIDPPATLVAVAPPSTTVSINPPLANIAIDPPAVVVAINPPLTTIAINPPRVDSVTGGESVTHSHGYTAPGGDTFVDFGGTGGTRTAAGPGYGAGSGAESRGHTHQFGFDIPAFNATVDIIPFNVTVNVPSFVEPFDIPPFDATVNIAAFNSTVDIAPFASGPLGAGAAFDVRPAYLAVNYIIKAH